MSVQVRLSHLYIFVCCVVFVWFTVLFITTYHIFKYIKSMAVPQPAASSSGVARKQILAWGLLPQYKAEVDEAGVLRCPPPELTSSSTTTGQCTFTTDRSRLGGAAAVVVSLSLTDFTDVVLAQARRPPGQVWAAVAATPPPDFASGRDKLAGVFNLTSTYTHDSDLPVPHGRWYRLQEQSSPPPHHQRPPQSKRRLVAWFASTCHTPSRREDVVRRVARLVPVDTYGSCGGPQVKLRCAKGRAACANLLRDHYFFYLALEPVRCRDYISEAFWATALPNGVVPVVLGPPPAAYSALAPPGSFVHLDHFPGPASLVRALTSLAANNTAYATYFEWTRRERGRLLGRSAQRDFWCPLCQLLTNGSRVAASHTATNVHTWWTRANQCYIRQRTWA